MSLTVLSILVTLFFISVVGWVLFFITLKKNYQLQPYKTELLEVQVGFDDICLEFVQALLVREKTAGATRLLSDPRLNLKQEQNKVYYYILRIILNFLKKDIQEGRKWIIYLINLYTNAEGPIQFEKDIINLIAFINAKFQKEEKELLLDCIDLVKGKIKVDEMDLRYNIYLKNKKDYVKDKTRRVI